MPVVAIYTVRVSAETAKRLEADAKRRKVKPGRAAAEAIEKVYGK